MLKPCLRHRCRTNGARATGAFNAISARAATASRDLVIFVSLLELELLISSGPALRDDASAIIASAFGLGLLFPANRLLDRAKLSRWERRGGRARGRFALMIAVSGAKLIFVLGLLDRPKTLEKAGISFEQFLRMAASRHPLGDKFEVAIR